MVTGIYHILPKKVIRRDANIKIKLKGIHGISPLGLLGVILAIIITACPGKFDVNLHKKAADTYYQNNEFDNAEREYYQILEKFPRDSDAHFQLGVIYYKKNDYKKSIARFMEVISIDRKFSKAYYNLAIIHATKGPYYNEKQAAIFFKEYLNLEPDSAYKEKIESWLIEFNIR